MDKRILVIIAILTLIGGGFYYRIQKSIGETFGAGSKISDMENATSVASTAILPIVDEAGVSNKKITVANLFATMASTTGLTALNVTSSTVTNITWNHATGTHTTSTNFYATTLLFANATGTNISATTGIYTTVCLTGDSCITTWPASGSSFIPQLTQVLNAGRSATSTPIFNMGFTAPTGTITNGTSTRWDTTWFGFQGATGTGLNLTGTLEAASTTVTTLNFTSATGSLLSIGGTVNSTLFSGALQNFGGAYSGFGIRNTSGKNILEASTNGVVGFFGSEAFFSMGDRTLDGGYGNSHTGGFYKNNGIFSFYNDALSKNTIGVADNGDVIIGVNNYGTYSASASTSSIPVGFYVNKTVSTFTGKVGIGSTAPTSTLTVAGSFSAGNATASSMNVTGAFTAGSSTVTTLNFGSATGASLAISGAFSSGSTTHTTLSFTNATGASIYASIGIFTTIRTASFSANSTGATSTNLYISANSILNKLTVTAGTSTAWFTTSLGWTNAIFGNATGTGVYATALGGLNATFTNTTATNIGVTSLLVSGKRVCLEDGMNCLPKALTLWTATSSDGYLMVITTGTQIYTWPYQGTWTLVYATATLQYAGAGGTSTQIDVKKENGTVNVSMLNRWLHIDPWGTDSDLAMSTTTVTISSTNGTVTAGDKIYGSILNVPNSLPRNAEIKLQFRRTQ